MLTDEDTFVRTEKLDKELILLLDQIEPALRALMEKADNDPAFFGAHWTGINIEELWGGADVQIMSLGAESLRSDGFNPVRKAVRTQYPEILSGLFDVIREEMQEVIDYSNKYDLFASLADAAIEVQRQSDDASARELCRRVIDAALATIARWRFVGTETEPIRIHVNKNT